MPSVGGDIAFSLGRLGLSTGEIVRRVDDALRTVGLEACSSLLLGPSIAPRPTCGSGPLLAFGAQGYGLRPVHTLSGGQRQRVAIAGVLAETPQASTAQPATDALLLPPTRCVTAAILRTRASRCCC